MQPNQEANPPAADAESADLFDYALLRDYLAFLGGSVLRRKMLASITCGAVVLASFLGLKTFPKTYHCEARILAQRNSTINVLSNPGVTMPWEYDAPTRLVAETVLRLDNLESIVRQTDLVNRWHENRAPVQVAKDWLMSKVRKPMTAQNEFDSMVFTLETRLMANVGEGTIILGVNWPDGQTAYKIVETALQNFLEARHVSESSSIAESISILELHTASVQQEIEAKLAELQKARRNKGTPGVATAHHRHLDNNSDEEVARLTMLLEAKRRAVSDLEDFRRRRLADLQTQMAQQTAVLAESHPTVVSLQQMIDALQQESPQLIALKGEERELESDLARRRSIAGAERAESEAAAATPVAQAKREAAVANATAVHEFDEAQVDQLRAQLRSLNSKLDTFTARIDTARLQLDASRAAFKFRYDLLRPPQVPVAPDKPNPMLVMATGVIIGLLFACIAAVAAELRAGRIFQRWQVERLLQTSILAEVHAP